MNQKFVWWEDNFVQVENRIDKMPENIIKAITLQHENNSKLNKKSRVEGNLVRYIGIGSCVGGTWCDI
jgi:hypothetical protein